MPAREDAAYVHFSSHASVGAEWLQFLLDSAQRPLIWETNVVTDPATGDTAIVFQFRGLRPMAVSLSLDDFEELVERVRLAQRNAGF